MSEIRTNKIANTAGVEKYLAQAWVNFNGTGAITIRASGNVDLIIDNGVGNYTVQFITPMVDANYCPVISTVQPTGAATSTRVGLIAGSEATGADGKTTSQLRVVTGGTTANSLNDSAEVNVAIFR